MNNRADDVETQAALWIIDEDRLTAAQIAERDAWLDTTPGARSAYEALHRTRCLVRRMWPSERH